MPKYCNTTPYFLWPEIITGDFLLKSSELFGYSETQTLLVTLPSRSFSWRLGKRPEDRHMFF